MANNNNNKSRKINPLVIGAAGLAVAGVAGAAVAMRNKKVSKNVKKIIGDAREQALDYASNLKDEIDQARQKNSKQGSNSKSKSKASSKKSSNQSKSKSLTSKRASSAKKTNKSSAKRK